MKVMTDSAGISGGKTNHSARKTMITKLVHNDVNPLHVAQLTGHKCLKSLDSYSKASLEQQKCMSRLISGHSQPMSNITNTAPVSNSSVAATTKSNSRGLFSYMIPVGVICPSGLLQLAVYTVLS